MDNKVIAGKRYRFMTGTELKYGTEKDPKVIKRLKEKVEWVLLDEKETEIRHFSKKDYFIDKQGRPAIKGVVFDKKYTGQTLYMTPYTKEPDISKAIKVVVGGKKLGMVADWSEDKKSVTVTYTVHPVNNYLASETELGITEEQFELLIKKRIQLVESVFSGKTAEDVMIIMKVVLDKNAVITWVYNPSLKVDNSVGEALGAGHTDNGIGNLRKNTNQIALYSLLKYDPPRGENAVVNKDLLDSGELIFSNENIKKVTVTGAHEDGHIAGLEHPEDTTDRILKRKIEEDQYNLMLFDNETESNILPEQLSLILQNIEGYK